MVWRIAHSINPVCVTHIFFLVFSTFLSESIPYLFRLKISSLQATVLVGLCFVIYKHPLSIPIAKWYGRWKITNSKGCLPLPSLLPPFLSILLFCTWLCLPLVFSLFFNILSHPWLRDLALNLLLDCIPGIHKASRIDRSIAIDNQVINTPWTMVSEAILG